MATAPPLRIWLYGLLLAGTVLALLIPLHQLVERKTGEALAGGVQQFLSAPHLRGQRDIRVLALGSSLLRAATPSVNYQSLHGVQWLRLAKSHVGFGHLGIVLESISKQPPDVLVVDTNLLLPSETLVDDLRDTLASVHKNAGYALMEQAGRGASWSERVLQQAQGPYACAPVSADRQSQQRAILIPQQKAELARAAVDPAVSSTLLRLSRQGVRIVLLELRRSAQFQHDLARDKQRWLQRWQRVLPPGPTIGYLTSPDFNDASLYCDGRHMNDAGARRLAPWWRHQLEQMGKEN